MTGNKRCEPLYSWRLKVVKVPLFTPVQMATFLPTCATLLGEQSLRAMEIASVTGDTSRSMVEHYTHATLPTARRAVAKLPNLDVG